MKRILYAVFLVMAWVIVSMLVTYDEKGVNLYNFFYSQEFYQDELVTNTAKSQINFEFIENTGTWKLWTPFIEQAKFITKSELVDSEEPMYDLMSEGIYLNIWNTQKFYPLGILHHHQIINDEVWNAKIAVSYSPHSWSTLAFNRMVNWEELVFKDSGKIYEAWMLMYDNVNESLWSQNTLEALVWDYSETKLEILDARRIVLSDYIRKYPEWLIMSLDTWFELDYNTNPHAMYDETEDIKYALLNEPDSRFKNKDKFLIVTNQETWESGAFNFKDLKLEGRGVLKVWNDYYKAEYKDWEVMVEKNYSPTPSYCEYWFSWINHNVWSTNIWHKKKEAN